MLIKHTLPLIIMLSFLVVGLQSASATSFLQNQSQNQRPNHVIVTPPAPKNQDTLPSTAPIEKSVSIVHSDTYIFSDHALRAGQNSLKSGDITTALAQFTEVLKRNPRSIDALVGSAYSYLKLGDTKQASRFVRNAVARDNTHMGAQFVYGLYFLQNEEKSRALDQLRVLNVLCGTRSKCLEALTLDGLIKSAP